MNRRPVEPDDLFALRFIQEAGFSPDGKDAVYSAAHADTEKDKDFSTIMLWSGETGACRALTNGTAKDRSPRFSPDGKSLAFISDRTGKPQIFILPLDGGEARQVTDIKQGVGGGPEWSPDGKLIAFTAGPDFEGDAPPDLSREAYRVTRTVYRFDGIGYLDQKIQDIYTVDSEGGEPTRLTENESNCHSLKWAPDGGSILYLSSMNPDSFRAMQPEIRIVSLTGGSGADVSPLKQDFIAGAAEWTPDGKKLLVLGRPDDGAPIGTKSGLWVLDVESGKMTCRTAGLDAGAGGTLSMRMPVKTLNTPRIMAEPDGGTAYVRVQNGGNVGVYRVSLTGKEMCEPVLSGDRACLPLDLHGNALLFAETDLNTPPELAVLDLNTGKERRITAENEEFLRTVMQPETERLIFSGPDGAEVEGWYMKPVTGSAPHPTILYIHGGPHAAYGRGFSFDFQMLAGRGYGVLFINHRASTGYGDEFSTAIKGDWGNLDYGDLMAGVDDAIHRGLADPDRMGVCGTSGGGNLSCWIIGHTDRFRAAVPQNPVTNWRSFYGTSDIGVWFSVEELGGHPQDVPELYEKCSPITYAHCCKTPTLMVQSESDWRCPAEQSEQFYSVLKANGCTAEMLRQPGGYHGASIYGSINLRREHLNAMADWFDSFVL